MFSHPSSDAAKRLVFPGTDKEVLPVIEGERIFRVVFNGVLATGSPVITQMAIDERIAATILSSSTRCIGDKVYGNMLIGLADDDNTVHRALTYLHGNPAITTEEVIRND